MVHKTDLRIGNLLRLNASFTHYFSVKEIADAGIYLYDGQLLKFDEIEPVALTPEILTSANFIFGRKFCGDDFYDLKLKAGFFGTEQWEFKRNNQTLRDVLYIHQVQNLYYVLSGEELKIVI